MSSDLGPAFGAGGLGGEINRANPQAQQFVALISSLYKNLAPLYDPDAALFEDANAWSKILRDARMRAFISMRLAKVARLTWAMEPASDSVVDMNAAATVEPFLRGIPLFTSARRHLSKFAFWGRSHGWIEGRRDWRVAGVSEKFPDGLLAEWWTPTLLRPLDKRQVIYKPERKKSAEGREVVSVETLLGTIDGGVHRAMEHPECLITCVYDDEVERLGYGRGLLETLYHLYWVIGVVRRIGLSGLEKWAHGIVAAKVDGSARQGTDETTEELAQSFLDTLLAMRKDGVMVVDIKDDIEVLSISGEGGVLTLKWLADCYEAAAQLCLGSIRPTGGGEGGSLARTEEEASTTDDLLDCDREMIDEAITNAVVKLWWDLNAGNLAAIGLGAAKMPRFRSLHTDREDPEKVGRTYKLAQEIGMEIGADDAHRRMGIPQPSPDEKKLAAPKPASPFGGLGTGPGFNGEGDPAETGARPDEPLRPGTNADAAELSALAWIRKALRALRGVAQAALKTPRLPSNRRGRQAQ